MITEAIVIEIVGHGIGSFAIGFGVGLATATLKKLIDSI